MTWREVRQDPLVDSSGSTHKVPLEINLSQLLLITRAGPSKGAATLYAYVCRPLIVTGNFVRGVHRRDSHRRAHIAAGSGTADTQLSQHVLRTAGGTATMRASDDPGRHPTGRSVTADPRG